MQDTIYEWEEEKNQRNIRKHGISLETATAIFDDPMLYEYHDKVHSGYNKVGVWEDRYIALGWLNKILYVVYTVRQKDGKEVTRMISARKATPEEKKRYEDWCNQY